MTLLTNKAYNVIKYGITIFLPAVGALYFAMAQIWDFQRITGVNGTINALITFGGLLIGYSSKQYQKTTGAPDGDLIVMQDEDGEKHLGLGVNAPSIEAMTSKDVVTLNVVDKTATDPTLPAPIITPSGAVMPPMSNVNPAIHPHEQSPPPAMPTQS